ncbi:hypothetical protein [Halomicrobium salinisoli]|uniref:hypothetical protein n=1 Tax=Halomicrobium salinisoli TaxID=2878391 RepID=UPI001CF05F9E|nr:hypothetical protein [Halomicrobium salinisoli]
MVDTETLKEVLPHYVAMFLLVFLALTVVRATTGEIGFWAELVVIAVVVFAYRPVVHRLGVAPAAWERR